MKGDFFIVEATRANFVFEKCLPPFWRGVVLGGCRMMDAEGSDRKTSPPFLASVFRFFQGFLVLLSLALGALGRRFFVLHLLCVSAEGFWFGPFRSSKPLGICFALVVPLSAEGLFFVLHLLCV